MLTTPAPDATTRGAVDLRLDVRNIESFCGVVACAAPHAPPPPPPQQSKKMEDTGAYTGASAAAKRKESARLRRKEEEERRIHLFAACRGGEVEVVRKGLCCTRLGAFASPVAWFLVLCGDGVVV